MTYKLAIGDRTYSSWSLRGWLMFAKFDIPVEVKTARMNTPEFREMLKGFGGSRTVPAMRNDDVVVSDTLAMAETLAETHSNMWPSDPVARGFARSIVAELHSGFVPLRDACTMNLRVGYDGFQPSEAVLKDVARIDAIWTEARTHFGANGPWLFGEYSIADVFYAPVVTRFVTYGLPASQVAQAYIDTTITDTTFRQWRARGLAENFIQPGYDLDLPMVSWAGWTPIPAHEVSGRTPINTTCPFSGDPVSEDCQIEIEGKIIATCRAFCRAKFIADPEAWPEMMEIVRGE